MNSALVLYSQHPNRLARFYRLLGITLTPEKHGDGAKHYAGSVGDTVLECYPARQKTSSTKDTFIFYISDIELVARLLHTADVTFQRHGKTLSLFDPDGRSVRVFAASV